MSPFFNPAVMLVLPKDLLPTRKNVLEIKHPDLNQKTVDSLPPNTTVVVIGPLKNSLTTEEIRVLDQLSEKSRIVLYGVDQANKEILLNLVIGRKVAFVTTRDQALEAARRITGTPLEASTSKKAS